MIAAVATSDQVAELFARHMAEHQITPWGTTLQHLALWSPGILILVGLYFLLRRPPTFVAEFIAAQQAQATGMANMATAVEQMTSRDRDRLDEILVGQQLILSRLEVLERRLPHGPH